MRPRLDDDVDGLAGWNRVVGSDLADCTHRFAYQVESRQRVANLTREWMRKRPRRNRQEFAAIRRHGKREALPQRLGDEWHDRVQQAQGVVEGVSEHRARNLAVVVR